MNIFKKISAITLAISLCFSVSVNVHAETIKIGARGDKVEYIQITLQALGLYNYETITSYYGEITAEGVKQYQALRGLKATGECDNETYELLKKEFPFVVIESESEQNALGAVTVKDKAKVGKLDWYEEVQYSFEKGMEATLIDVDTGKSFKIMRTFGHNHADVEPLTAKDAEIMFEIWGGSSSWVRRAVVVLYGAYIVAGSMTAFPHAGKDSAPSLAVVSGLSGGYGTGQNLDSVKDNGVSGVCCLHFLNSVNHGSNASQKNHQDAVNKAAKYIEATYN